VYGTRANVPDSLVTNGRTYRLVTDHLGSPRLVVDVTTGVVAQRLDYDEFGQVLLDTNPGYRNRPMDLADAALVRIAERERIRTVFTVDRGDFEIYRPSRSWRFSIVPR